MRRYAQLKRTLHYPEIFRWMSIYFPSKRSCQWFERCSSYSQLISLGESLRPSFPKREECGANLRSNSLESSGACLWNWTRWSQQKHCVSLHLRARIASSTCTMSHISCRRLRGKARLSPLPVFCIPERTCRELDVSCGLRQRRYSALFMNKIITKIPYLNPDTAAINTSRKTAWVMRP